MCRSPTKAAEAITLLKAATGKTDANIGFIQMDLGDLASIHRAVAEFLTQVLLGWLLCSHCTNTNYLAENHALTSYSTRRV